MADPYLANVSLLLYGDDPTSTAFTDSSPTPHGISRVGTTITNSSLSPKYGLGSLNNSDAQAGLLRFANNGSLILGLGDYTIEGWFKPTANGVVFGNRSVSSENAVGTLNLVFTGGQIYLQSGAVSFNFSGAPATGVWSHVAWSRASGTTRVFVDGVQIGSSSAVYDLQSTNDFVLFNSSLDGVGTRFTGGIDEFRVTKGVARYTANFTPPTQIAPRNTLDASLVSPVATLLSYGGGGAFITPAEPTLSASGGSVAALTSPSPALFATARSSMGDNSFVYTSPRANLSAFGGANTRLRAPSPALTAAATFAIWGEVDISAPSATLSASGTVSGVGRAALTFYDPYKLVGYSGAVTSITLAGSPTIQATGTTGAKGGATLTAPLLELTASGTAQNYGSANLLAPAARLGAQAQAWLVAPGFTMTTIGSATITATYEAYAVNLLHRNTDTPVDETTRYTNFPFTHVVRYKNSYYGANSTGLYLLEGTTDDGAAIPWELKTTITDFESPMAKTAVSAYFAGRMGPAATVGIHLGESGDVSYSHSTPRGPAAQNYRQVFGLGLKSRYYALSVAGEGVMELDSVEFNTKTLTRRI